MCVGAGGTNVKKRAGMRELDVDGGGANLGLNPASPPTGNVDPGKLLTFSEPC